MDDCIFCKIVKGEIPCYKIYEDDMTIAFLDIANDIEGHTLVVPKKHFKNVLDCDSEYLSAVISVVKKIGQHYVKCGYDGFNIVSCNNKSAEQSVFHLHFHIMPRKEGDNVKVYPTLNGSSKTLEEVRNLLKMEEWYEKI